MNQRKTRQFGIVLGGLAVALAGCSILPEPKADPTRFYLLSTAATPASPAAPVVGVQFRPVEAAGYLRNPPIVVRRGEHEVEFRDLARWGEPLEQGIARVLREELRARGVSAAGDGAREETPPTLGVRVLACEGTAAGAVEFRAAWELVGTGAGGKIRRGEFRATGLRWDPRNESTLAARLSEAVAGLAEEISQAVAGR